jgi:hypothetical protein
MSLQRDRNINFCFWNWYFEFLKIDIFWLKAKIIYFQNDEELLSWRSAMKIPSVCFRLSTPELRCYVDSYIHYEICVGGWERLYLASKSVEPQLSCLLSEKTMKIKLWTFFVWSSNHEPPLIIVRKLTASMVPIFSKLSANLAPFRVVSSSKRAIRLLRAPTCNSASTTSLSMISNLSWVVLCEEIVSSNWSSNFAIPRETYVWLKY